MILTARARSGTLGAAVALVVLLGLVGLLPLDRSTRYLLTVAMCWGVAAVGLDLFSGYLGQSSFGHAAFVGVGAYAVTVLRTQVPLLGAPASLILALLLSAAIALVVGLALVQLRHFGAALTTFFFALVVMVLLSGNLLDPIAHSQAGLAVPPLELRLGDLGADKTLYVVTWLLLLLAVVVTSNYANSRAGRALRLVKQNEVVAATMGVNVRRTKLVAFVYSAVVAALAGLPFSLAVGFLGPETFSPTESITLFAMGAVGGLGSVVGPILGALFFTIAPQMLQIAGTTKAILFSSILLASLIFFPEGIYGAFETVRDRWPRGQLRSQWRQARGRPDRQGGAAEPPLARVASAPARPAPDGAPAAGILTVEQARVQYGGIAALQDAGLTVREGDTHALIGPNGAGKTTLLNCISGVQRLGGGTITFRGEQIAGLPASTIRRLGIARTFQHPTLVPDLSAIDNVKLGLYGTQVWSLARDLAGRPATAAREGEVEYFAARALRQLDFDPSRDRVLAKDLSLAETRMVDIARAIASGAALLLLDEPTAGLSAQQTSEVTSALQIVKGMGLTVLLVAHDVKFVVSVADQMTVLDQGRVIAAGLPEQVIHHPEVVEAYLGAPMVVSAP